MLSYKCFKNGKINLMKGSELIGSLLMVDLKEPSIFIKYIDVKEKYQNKGYGSLLLNHAIELYKNKEAVSLYVSKENINAIRFYHKNNFFISCSIDKSKGKYSYLMMSKKLI